MKPKKLIFTICASALALTACDDQIMQWQSPDGNVSIADIPLDLREKLANYDFVKVYAKEYMPGVTIGAGIGADLYTSDEQYKQVTDDNFQILTTGNAMKHSSVVQNNGTLNFSLIDRFLAAVPADMQVYGHNFLWHTQQRQAYLRSLIAPEMVIEAGNTDKQVNIINNSDFETGDITGWGAWSNDGCTAEISADGEGFGGKGYAMKLTNPVAGDNYTAQAFYTLPEGTLVAGETYVYTFYVRSVEGDEKFQIQLQKRADDYPGAQYSGSIPLPAGEWTPVEREFTATEADEAMTHIVIDFGGSAGVYYIDDFKFGKKKEAAPPVNYNIINNSDFETGDITGWAAWSNDGCTAEISADGEGFGGKGYAMKLMNPVAGDNYTAQAFYTLPEGTLVAGETYVYTFYVRSIEGDEKFQIQLQKRADDYPGTQYSGSIPLVAGEWTPVEMEFTATEADEAMTHIVIDFGGSAGVYYIDDFTFGKKYVAPVTRAVTRAGGISYTLKTPEEKETALLDAMESWIRGMLEHVGSRVVAWDVVNEPIADNSQLRGIGGNFMEGDGAPEESTESGLKLNWANDHWYWGYYLGKDYAVRAFEFARKYAGLYATSEVKLFINDYNLETNPSKLKALIDYAKYIDENNSAGVPLVDGIGTQMHVQVSITRGEVDAMFKTLAATGKLVRVTELDVALGTATPSAEQLAQQAAVYQMIFESFKANVPQAQQSGITIWSLTDAAREHEYWLKDDAPNIFDADYGRKHAYKGVCDGIAGRDISEDFNGEDWAN
ncbi:MAG: endo-1,4-beta-xylanase [Mediterranea sp.]|jgi:GH35 family endo-1,4-beta-xylanase|nr:endo-1,4-beta-xylanase [Mediterranea sp.]